MRWNPLGAVCVLAASVAILSGCSSDTEPAPTSSSAAPSTSMETELGTAPPVPPGEVGVSPGGVTTAVGAPADSTEDDYFQACRAAKAWMEQQGGDPKAQIEPYLKMVQSAEFVGPGTFHVPWSQLSPGQQSAVIVAVQAGADALCG
ncbi:lipoprotein LpqV [Mycolicibacterium sp. CR10]|uniref:lipoprotein LpqV n=1 Tax=Mycolicibacterium sp. CR10 TaxID=2562314 RepID=UPI0010C14E78|nr:lipoprotein LpqV [Mycolicibacterium sp. CR10]